MSGIGRSIALLMIYGFCQGAALAGSEPEQNNKILVLPFRSLSPKPELAWIGPAVQQSLLSDLSAALPRGATQADAAAIDSDDAIRAAQKLNARFVVFGSYQSIDGLVRLTGQVWDARENEPAAVLKVTGHAHDIFGMEDELATQIKHALPRQRDNARPNSAPHTGPTAAELAIQSSGPLRLSLAPEAPDAAISYAQPYVYSSQATQAGDWRYVYGGFSGISLYYGYGYGYYPCYGFGCGGWFGGFGYCAFGGGCGYSSYGGNFSSAGRSYTSPNGGAGPVNPNRAHGHGGHR